MSLMDWINKLERKAKWRESSEAEVEFGCTVLLAVVLCPVLVIWLLSK